MKTFIQAILLFTFLLSHHVANARPFGFLGPDISAISTEDATKREIERVQKLSLSKSAALNQESLTEARTSAESYGAFQERITSLESIPFEAISKKIANASALLPTYIKGCQKKQLLEQILIIRNQLNSADGLGVSGSAGFPGYPSTLTEAEQATMQEVIQFLGSPPETICTQYGDAKSLEAIQKQINTALTSTADATKKEIVNLKDQAPRAKLLTQAWEKRRDDLLKAIEDQSAPANKVAEQLGWIIGIFCIFGILMFISVNVFKESVQIELVTSGQVIQFATVMVLLIVICVLGMSQLLKENVLGTLLGGIGGYVLSQGVGRAATRAATRGATQAPQADVAG